MAISQYFIPCRGGIDPHEHNVYCGCSLEGVGEEVFPQSYKILSSKKVLDLKTKLELMVVECEILKKEEIRQGECLVCNGGEVIVTKTTYRTAQGAVRIRTDNFGVCKDCGAI